MRPHELQAARAALGMTQQELGDALRMGAGSGRTIRRYEAGKIRIPGPVEVALELMIEKRRRR